MPSRASFSTQFDDVRKLAGDLLAPLQELSAGHSLAVLLCDSHVDIHALLPLLGEALPMPLVGGTTIAFPLDHAAGEDADGLLPVADSGGYGGQGPPVSFEDAAGLLPVADSGGCGGQGPPVSFKDISASLLILDKPGMTVSVALSEPLKQADHAAQMRDVHSRARAQLGEEPRMLMPFFPLIPGLVADLFIADLFDLAGEVPVYGGMTLGDLVTTPAAIFADGRVFSDRMALVLLGGDIQPVFASANSMTPMADYAPTITRSEECNVCRVDDMSFCDYMRTLGIAPEDRVNGVDALMQYGPIPVEVTLKGRPDDGVTEIRCISFTNLDAGTATFSGNIPEGAKVRMGILSKDDVIGSSREIMETLISRMREKEADGYSFDALFCVSCVARYFVMVGGSNQEQELLTKAVPPHVAASGYYGFCEIGPTFPQDGRGCRNRSYSASIVLCAI